MLVSLFGIVDAATISQLAIRGHQFLTSDSPSDAKTIENLEEARATFALQKAAWRDLNHPLSKEGQRANNDGKLEAYNTNGGFVRDALMVEKSDASIVGESVSPGRLALIDRIAAQFDRPVRTVAIERIAIDRAMAEAELDNCFGTSTVEPKPKRQRKAKVESSPEATADVGDGCDKIGF